MSEIVRCLVEDGVLTVRIERAERRNVLSLELMQELTRIAKGVEEDPNVRAVILTAAGPNFSAGVDLKDPRRWALNASDLAARRGLPRIGERMCEAWEDIPVVTICAIEGHCVGGGAALAIATDFRVIGASAYMHFPEIALGLPLSWGALPRLVRLVGPARAKRVVILGEKLVGQDAVEFGVAEYLAADGDAYAKAQALARNVAALPGIAVAMSKEAINVTSNALNRLSSYMAHDQLALAADDPEAVAIRAQFAARGGKRP